MTADAASPPPLAPDLPGVGGFIKVHPQDFEVEEIPAYEPTGSGEHLFMWVQKTDIGPEHLSRTIAQRLGVPVNSVGAAGLKDRRAVTRQWISVPASAEARVNKANGGGIEVLKTARHTNKLKPGHSHGNRFRILVREADRGRAAALDAILERLRTQGIPNYYGPQRFGRDNSTLDLGFDCLAGKQPRRIRPFVYKFALSAVQSLLFNDVLMRRIADGIYRTVLAGDVMTKRPFGGLFTVEDIIAEQSRFDARETVTAGPMFGKHTYAAAGVAAEREAAVLAAHGLNPRSFDNFGQLMGGTRRANIVYLDDLAATWEPDGLRLEFSLPGGSYATVLLAEIMKSGSVEGDDDGD